MRILCDDGDKEIVDFFTWWTAKYVCSKWHYFWMVKDSKGRILYQPSVMLVPGAIKTSFERKCLSKCSRVLFHLGKCFCEVLDVSWRLPAFETRVLMDFFLIFFFGYNMYLLFTWRFLLIDSGKDEVFNKARMHAYMQSNVSICALSNKRSWFLRKKRRKSHDLINAHGHFLTAVPCRNATDGIPSYFNWIFKSILL